MATRFSKTDLVQSLEQHIGAPVGIEGLNILLYGWKKARKFGTRYLDALKHRDWFYVTDVIDLSAYAGYDLTTGTNGAVPKRESESAHLSES